jgi:hypothetical protein
VGILCSLPPRRDAEKGLSISKCEGLRGVGKILDNIIHVRGYIAIDIWIYKAI